MAEFCLDCWNKLNETADSEAVYILSREAELCEGCGEYKPVILAERLWPQIHRILANIIKTPKNNTRL